MGSPPPGPRAEWGQQTACEPGQELTWEPKILNPIQTPGLTTLQSPLTYLGSLKIRQILLSNGLKHCPFRDSFSRSLQNRHLMAPPCSLPLQNIAIEAGTPASRIQYVFCSLAVPHPTHRRPPSPRGPEAASEQHRCEESPSSPGLTFQQHETQRPRDKSGH